MQLPGIWFSPQVLGLRHNLSCSVWQPSHLVRALLQRTFGELLPGVSTHLGKEVAMCPLGILPPWHQLVQEWASDISQDSQHPSLEY